MIKVLIADDHHLIRTSLAHLLNAEKDLRVIGEASSGEEAIAETRRLRPDIVLMDIRMPGIGGLEATRKITQTLPDARVLVLTAWLEDSFAQRLLDAGAWGLVSKGSRHDEMIVAIHEVFQGHRYVSPDVAQRLILSRIDSPENPFEELSSREMQVAMMIINCQKVATIAERLFLSPKTVNTYRYRIFEKLGVSSDVELTHLGLRHGLVEGFSNMQ
ncbi:MAG: response regulator [Halomonas sp.]|uniref:response regulator n=1 Tax=Halomonas TaxID=2745 RepID=UPI00048385C6|nr:MULTISPECIES: response regulator [Halomonas]NWN84084.1 response regulator [Halomonas sp.]